MFYSADEIRAAPLDDRPTVSLAIFPPEKYTGTASLTARLELAVGGKCGQGGLAKVRPTDHSLGKSRFFTRWKIQRSEKWALYSFRNYNFLISRFACDKSIG